MPRTPDTGKKPARSEFVDALLKGALLGLAILAVAIPTMRWLQNERAPQAPTAAATAPAAPGAPAQPAPPPRLRLADFGKEVASADARHVAHWAVHSGDHQRRAFVVIDKKNAQVFAFGPDGRLVDSTPALLGSAVGDDSAPGIGDKPLAAILPHEKTTPAGRFVALPGRNATGEDIIWIDYDAAVSMHRVRPLVASERRLERLATPTVEDNRISFGCVNLPVAFYEGVLSPLVKRHGAIVYVLPETRTPQEVFGSYEVGNPVEQLAAR